MCGNACPVPINVVVTCVGGMCMKGGCAPGFADCDNNPMNGCEVKLATDLNHCGACGKVCAGMGQNAVAACVNGACSFNCNPGWGNCDNNLGNGCEKDITSDPLHCGACGNVCPQNAPNCGAGVCSSLGANLIAYWKFDGNFNDSIGNNTLVVPNGQKPPNFAGGKLGQGTESPMGDPYNLWITPRPPAVDNNVDFTLAFWGRTNSTTWYDSYAAWDSGGIIVYRHQGHSWRFMLSVTEMNNQNYQIDSNIALPQPPDNTWFFVVVYRSGNTLGLRINGNAPVTRMVGAIKNGSELYVSRNVAGYSWPGQLDEMGYWNRALSPGEMDQLYNNGNGRTLP